MILSGFGRNVGSPEGMLAACALTEVSSAIFATSQLCLEGPQVIFIASNFACPLSPTPA